MIKLTFTLVLFLAFAAAGGFAQNKLDGEIREAAKTAQKATRAIDEIMAIRDKSIPVDLLRRANAVAVFPNVIKGAFIVGGQGGKGVIIRRTPSGWGPPALFKLGGGSVGFQIGASSTDVIMLFMTESSSQNLLEDRFEIGGEASAAAGPIGRTAKAATDAQLRAQILSYSRSKGLFAGISIAGAVISPNDDANRALYRQPARVVLGVNMKQPLAVPPAVRPFQQSLARYAK